MSHSGWMFHTNGQYESSQSPAAKAAEEHLSHTMQMSSCSDLSMSSLTVGPIGRDADATVLRSLDVRHLPSRPQHREVRQDTASRQSSDLLQLVRSFQLLSSFGHEAIAMPWTWAVQSRQATKNNLIYVTDYSFSRLYDA